MEIAPDGTIKKRLCYETLGIIPRKEASETLRRKMAESGNGKAPTRSRVTFRTLARQWEVDVLPTKYKRSTQKNHRHIMEKHLISRFGDVALCDVTTQAIQTYVTHLTKAGYAPKSIDHIHDVLSAILRSAVKWGHLGANPAHGVEMPRLKTVRPKWALTVAQATALLEHLPWRLPRTMVALALLTGLRRGELFALRWRDVDEQAQCLHVREAVYEGLFDDPKTEAGIRLIPLSDAALQLVQEWRTWTKRTEPDQLLFSTVSGKPIAPNNIFRTWVWPACDAAGVPRVTWLTFRRAYSSWAHDKGVPGKVVAQIMGHVNVDTTINVYTQVLDGAARAAADRVGSELFTIVHNPAGATALTH
ncbi:MAG: tyrosine-type recombinase/integrase [Vicinamibacteraceae bacterium]